MATITGTNGSDTIVNLNDGVTNSSDQIYSLEGNDLVNGLDGNDTIVGENEQFQIIRSAITGNITDQMPIFGADTLKGGRGNDLIYGDLVNATFKVEAGQDSPVSFSPALISMILGNDILMGEDDNDTLTGDVGQILFSVKAGITLNIASSATLQNFSIKMGADTIMGGSGNDTIYGDTQHLRLESIAGTSNSPSTLINAATSLIQGVTITATHDVNMVNDRLYGDSGNDVLYGDVGIMELLAQGGQSLNTSDSATGAIRPVASANSFTMGNDHLWGGTGDDALYGDIGTLDLRTFSGSSSGGASSAQAQMIGLTFNMGHDVLYGENGKDVIYGDIGNINILVKGGTSSTGSTTAFFQPLTFLPDTLPNVFNMGDDYLYGDNGDDELIGDIGIVNIEGIGGTSSSGNSNAQVKGTFNMGDDTLDGGAGNDQAYGDIEEVQVHAQAGTVTGVGGTVVALVGAVVVMGDDILLGRAGNDVLYGDLGNLILDYHGGTNSSANTQSEAHATAITANSDVPLRFTMGSDQIIGDSGNDHLYGDINTIDIEVEGGINTGGSALIAAANALVSYFTVTMGDDKLDGGSGNDTLYGDLANFSMLLIPGIGVQGVGSPEAGAYSNNSVITFGDDILIGGKGNDVLYGDIPDPSQLNSFLNATPLPPPFPLGVQPPIPNQVIYGEDTFEFSLASIIDNDIIKDMNAGGVLDTLKFTDVKDVGAAGLDVSDVDAVASFSADINNHVVVKFAGGSITFENTPYAGQDSLLDITSNVIVG